MLLLNDLVDALSWESILWRAGQCKGRHQLRLQFSTYPLTMSTVTGRRQPCGKKGKFRPSLLLFPSLHLTLKAPQGHRELWWQASVLTARAVAGQSRVACRQGGDAALMVPLSECRALWGSSRARGRLTKMSVLECHVAVFLHHLGSVCYTEMGSSDLRDFYPVIFMHA